LSAKHHGLSQVFKPMSTNAKQHGPFPATGWSAKSWAIWLQVPNRWQLAVFLVVWVALFQFLGNSTLGYVDSRSLFGWWLWVYTRGAAQPDGSISFSKLFDGEEAHAWFIPAVVGVLFWCRREELMALPKRVWWPALGIFVAALLLHVAGYMVQQSRLSLVAFFVGIYGFTGLLWGAPWLRTALFPFALFAFCVPLGTMAEGITFPLRMLATDVTALVCQTFLGINVVQNGTQLFDAAGSYQYEVAAACSGIRSLTAILAFGVIYGYMTFQTTWRRLAIVAAAFPLAVIANAFRLTLIVLAAEAFGQNAGNYVHENSWFSLAPYVPSIGGMLALGWWMRENRASKANEAVALQVGSERGA
jgi:exosortase